MQKLLERLNQSAKHLNVLHRTFTTKKNFVEVDQKDFQIYKENSSELEKTLTEIKLYDEIYSEDDRQMILADLFEYVLLGRGIYAMTSVDSKQKFVKSILLFVNLLMCFESITVSTRLRRIVLMELKKEIPHISKEEKFKELFRFRGRIGLAQSDTEAPRELNKYFDKMLPKTAGGLWHELLVYIFLLRSNKGYILPLLLTQKLYSKNNHLIPPDFLLLTEDKRIYGVQVGTRKEIQSGSFSLRTAIPTANIDTINSRNSDRCPSCKRWINFCPHVIENYSKFDLEIKNVEVRCLEECKKFDKIQIIEGVCKYTKYSRSVAKTLEYTHHDFADGLHYHYQCVLKNVSTEMKNKIILSKDSVAIKTHYPFYAGLEELNK